MTTLPEDQQRILQEIIDVWTGRKPVPPEYLEQAERDLIEIPETPLEHSIVEFYKE